MATSIRWTYNPDDAKIGTIELIDDDGYARMLIAQGRAVLAAPTENNDPADIEPASPPSLRNVLVYYSIPNGVNGRFNNDYAAGVFSRYDDVIIGAGLAGPESPYYADTAEILTDVSPATTVWGYIDLSVAYNNYTMEQIAARVDQWADIGADGIFWDLYGYDYGVSRARQNAAVTEARRRGLRSMANVWNVPDAFSPAVDVTWNPTGVATLLDHRDVMFLESWVFNTDAFGVDGWSFIGFMTSRAVSARTWRRTNGAKIYSSSIVKHTGRTTEELDVYRDLAEMLARAFSFDGSNCAMSEYAAGGDDLAIAVPHRWVAPDLPFRPAAEYNLKNFNTSVERGDLGLQVDFPDAGPRIWTLEP